MKQRAVQASFRNQHCPYAELPKAERRALKAVLATAFQIGKSSHELWSDFPDITAFLRRQVEPAPDDTGIVAAAIVMSYPAEQYDYLAYIAVDPDHQRPTGLLRRRAVRPRHGTHLLHYLYEVMRDRVEPSRPQQHLMIEPAGDIALSFYLNALPTNDYPLRFFAEDRVILVSYDGLSL